MAGVPIRSTISLIPTNRIWWREHGLRNVVIWLRNLWKWGLKSGEMRSPEMSKRRLLLLGK